MSSRRRRRQKEPSSSPEPPSYYNDDDEDDEIHNEESMIDEEEEMEEDDVNNEQSISNNENDHMGYDGEEDYTNPSPEHDIDPHVDEDTLRIMVATDNHLGYAERDPIRGNDSFAAFEEILILAKRHNVSTRI